MNRAKSPRAEEEEKKGDRRRAREKAPKRGGGNSHNDDDDVDSRGNIRGLIAYSSESESENSSTSSDSEPRRRPPSSRRAAEIARKRIAKKAAKDAEKLMGRKKKSSTPSSSDSSYRPTPKSLRKRAEETEDEDDSESEEEEEEEEEEEPVVHRRGFLPRSKRSLKKEESEDEEEEEDEDEGDEDEDEEEEDEEEDEEDDDEDDKGRARPFGLSISFGGGDDDYAERMIPRRHNMKKESKDVNQFVKLITKPVEENTIDDQIDQFKALDSTKQKALLESLEKREEYTKKEQPLMFRLLGMKLTPEMMATVMSRYNALQQMDPSTGEYYKLRSWMEKLVSMPLGQYRDMPVKLEDGTDACTKFMEYARKCLEDAIYGQEEAKLQILQFIACKLTNPTSSGLSLLLIGPPGIGKTSLIKNGIAKAIGWPFQFISLGGDSDAMSYVGHQFVYEGSHCGKIANCLAQSKSLSTVLMFDELDKISTTAKGEEVQNLLVHLTDPVQNSLFEDKYLTGIPLDLSRIMFVFSGNDINKIDKILLDRMVVVRLAGYGVKEKLAIAEQYLMPAALKEVALAERVGIGRDILQYILENYTGEEQGVRELKRCCEQIVQKINMLRMFNAKDLPFHIPNFSLPFVVKKEHVDLFLKKKDPPMDVSVQRMYT
jgi:hypothetical protein